MRNNFAAYKSRQAVRVSFAYHDCQYKKVIGKNNDSAFKKA
jgi:hypothetical protein